MLFFESENCIISHITAVIFFPMFLFARFLDFASGLFIF